jgi:hypothetical protein
MNPMGSDHAEANGTENRCSGGTSVNAKEIASDVRARLARL